MAQTPYEVLARKHRPQTFDDLVGQESISSTLKNSLIAKKLAHAYLFFGTRGTGKTTTARILAKALNCVKGPTPEPCLKCDPCIEIAKGNSMDVLEMDAATHTQVDKVREVIIESVALSPVRDRYKIFIIDEAHMLSTASFNALLKTLEEPPAHVVFMLATTEQQKIPATIFSRCQRYRFKPQGLPSLVTYLQKVAKLEKVQADADALELLAKAADGSMRDAVSLLDQAVSYSSGKLTREVVRSTLGQLPEEILMAVSAAILARDAQALSKSFDQALEEGQDPGALLKELRGLFHRLYLNKLGLQDLEKPWSELAAGVEAPAVAFILRRMIKGLEELRYNEQARLSVELTLFGLLDSPYDLREWVAKLEALEARVGKSPSTLVGEGGDGGKLAKPSPRPASPSPQRPAASPSPHLDPPPQVGRKPAEQPKAPAAAPAKPAPAAAPAISDDGVRAAWARVVGALKTQKPALGDNLESARFETSGGRIILSFSSNFRKDGVERQRDVLAQALLAMVGSAVPVEFRFDRDAMPNVTAPAAPEEQAEPAGPSARDAGPLEKLPGTDPLSEDPGIQRALKVFPGKVFKPKSKE